MARSIRPEPVLNGKLEQHMLTAIKERRRGRSVANKRKLGLTIYGDPEGKLPNQKKKKAPVKKVAKKKKTKKAMR
jgi:hypothetical protein